MRRALILIILAMCLAVFSCRKEEVATDTGRTDTSTTDTATNATSQGHEEHLPLVDFEPPRTDCGRLSETEFDVAISFTGLMMMVPDGLDTTRPLAVMDAAKHKPVAWTVLIPNARDRTRIPSLPPVDPGEVHSHVPFLGVDPQYLCTESTAERSRTWCPRYLYHDLNGVDVRWDTTASALSGPPSYSLTFSGDGVCPTEADKDSLHWVPSLSEVGFKDHTFVPEFFASRPPAELIAGRTRLEGGTLAACVTSAAKMNFRVLRNDDPGPVTQALAEETHYTFRGRGKTFTVTLQPIAGGEAKTVVLAPVNGRIELTVGNVPQDFIAPTGVTGDAEAVDAHFGVYHRFLQTVEKPIIPHLADLPCDSTPCTRVISRPCNPPAGGFPSPEGGNCGKIKP